MKRAVTVALLSAFLIAGCSARSVRIAELKDQPGRYDDKSVSVTGRVTSSWGLPLVPFRLYNVDDGTGEITVVSQSGGNLTRGTRVQVKGKLSEVALVGNSALGLHLQEQSRKVRN